MERLTERNIKLCQIRNIPHETFYYKLQGYEDFMEEQGFESLEEFKQAISMMRLMNNSGAKCLAENKSLNERWEKLKIFIGNRIDCAPYEVKARSINDILNKMEELENESKGGDEANE